MKLQLSILENFFTIHRFPSNHEIPNQVYGSQFYSVSLEAQIPVMFGILTTETIEQAIERAGTKAGNKGFDVALGAIEMANLSQSLEKG